ncbi:hypothetical protein LC724_08845 [Blautia sp. RD014234]|nr:hypothetical protein [Blautia parvula]
MDAPAYGKRLGVDALHPIYAHLQHPGFLEQCREEKLPLHVWTVNTKERFRQMEKAGVDVVITQFSGYTILVIVWRKALWKAK